MKIVTDERCLDFSRPGHPERPGRVSRTIERLRSLKGIPLTWIGPEDVSEAAILRAHSPGLLTRLEVEMDFDADTPYHPDIASHARRSVGGALAVLAAARAGEHAFSLMRPPGHHATREASMGFCYLNSIAIAVLEALAAGVKKIAVLDFDVHHGNGTEDILLGRSGAAFYSIHEFPCYPNTGGSDVGDNCFNFPVAPGTARADYRRVLSRAIEGIGKFGPDLLAVSAGFDAYARDPLAQETLEAEDFHWLGESIRRLGIPSFNILEGGYSSDLPELIIAYLKGLDGI